MFVVKRDGKKEAVKFDKITARISKLCYGLNPQFVGAVEIAKKVIIGVYDGETTVELDNLAAETAAYLTTVHPDYAKLAARIAVSNLHKTTNKSFSKTICSCLTGNILIQCSVLLFQEHKLFDLIMLMPVIIPSYILLSYKVKAISSSLYFVSVVIMV